MKIEMKALAAGPEGIVHPGTRLDVDAKAAKALLDGNFAVEVKAEKAGVGLFRKTKAENAAMRAPEQATLPSGAQLLTVEDEA